MSGYIVDKDLVNRQLGLETKYDLTGFVNHMGTLGNGHYTANVRNPFTRKWHVYDDHHVTEIQETSMTKEHAYLLFYVRKDMQGKGLRAAFPNIESDYFPGKPIITKSG
jgi:ubiquitin C-terminal hydrolase